jgi:Malectin domain
MQYQTWFSSVFLIWLASAMKTATAIEVIFAVNAAGESYRDPTSGIIYETDTNSEGGNYTWGANIVFGGLDVSEQTIYRAVRSGYVKFGYNLPITKSGYYALVLHFSDDEGIDQRVFNVVLNGEHTILSNFGVARACGYRNICCEVVYFIVCNGQLSVNNQVSTIKNEKIRVEFVEVTFNPLVAGIALITGRSGEELSIPGCKKVVF